MENANTLRRGTIWTSPLWALVLLNTAAAAYGPVAELLGRWETAYEAFMYVFLAGSSFCLLPGWAFAGRENGFLESTRRALVSVTAVAASYLLFAAAAFFLGEDPKGRYWGGGFGLAGACGSFVAALIGAWSRLLLRFLGRTFLNPYAPPQKPFQPRK